MPALELTGPLPKLPPVPVIKSMPDMFAYLASKGLRIHGSAAISDLKFFAKGGCAVVYAAKLDGSIPVAIKVPLIGDDLLVRPPSLPPSLACAQSGDHPTLAGLHQGGHQDNNVHRQTHHPSPRDHCGAGATRHCHSALQVRCLALCKDTPEIRRSSANSEESP